jgi:uncharacterized protein YkwD
VFKYIFKVAFETLVILVVLAFVGVQPLAEMKNNLLVERDQAQASSYIDQFNEYRVSNGLRPLEVSIELNAMAEKRTRDLISDYSHKGAPLGYGENIAIVPFGYSALEIWKSSPEHRENLLKARYTSTGYASNFGFTVQLFR